MYIFFPNNSAEIPLPSSNCHDSHHKGDCHEDAALLKHPLHVCSDSQCVHTKHYIDADRFRWLAEKYPQQLMSAAEQQCAQVITKHDLPAIQATSK